jgi:hypothetical protein
MRLTEWPAIVVGALLVCTASAAGAAQRERDSGSARLAAQVAALDPDVSRAEAARLASAAYAASHQLRREYAPVGSPHFDNFLINAGLKKRGLCHHWTRDLGDQLAALKLRTLVLRWGIARRGTLREHNSVVVTARGQPFARGIVLDPWRYSGRLFAGPVALDKYPWEEDPHDRFRPRSRAASRARSTIQSSKKS